MKPTLRIALICLLTVPVFAQRGGAPGGGHGIGGGGGRGIAGGRPGFGGGSAGPQKPFDRYPSGRFPAGFSHGTFRDFSNTGFSRGGGFGYGLGLGYGGLGYGVGYLGSGFGLGYSYPLANEPQSNVTVVYPPPAAPPVVNIYTEPPRPVIRDYDWSGADAAQPAAASSPIYLIAFRDGSIRAASSYRLEGKSLHYITMEGDSKQAALDSVDRPMSLRLNRERRVPFQLPE